MSQPPVEPAHLLIADRIAARAQAMKPAKECLVVGLCGSQGSGKSTLTAILQHLLQERGLSVATLSLDDVYLTRRAREALAGNVHPLLRTRGVPGTHDMSLALQTLAALRREGTVAVPLFDKARDDRRPTDEWAQVRAPVDVILFEGWCVGAVPQSAESLREPVNSLEKAEDADGTWRRYVNDALGQAYRLLFGQIDFLILLAAPGFEVVHRWRLEQENTLRRNLGPGADVSQLLSAQQLERFIAHYERLTRHILSEMPERADMVVRLDAQRRMTIEG
jgi:D-glycerate 3-kinase